jgi:hypothetical protein
VTQAVNAVQPGAVSSTLTLVNNDNFVFAPAISGNAGDVVSFAAGAGTMEPRKFLPVGHQPPAFPHDAWSGPSQPSFHPASDGHHGALAHGEHGGMSSMDVMASLHAGGFILQ